MAQMQHLRTFLLLAALVAVSNLVPASADLAFCQKYISDGKPTCPNVQPQSNLNLAKLQGRWYEVASSASEKFIGELGSSCLAFDLSKPAAGKNGTTVIKVTRRGKNTVGPIRTAQIATLGSASRWQARHLYSACIAVAAPKLPKNFVSYSMLLSKARSTLSAAKLSKKTATETASGFDGIAGLMNGIDAQAQAIYGKLEGLQSDLGTANQVDQLPKLESLKNKMGNVTADIAAAAKAIQNARKRIIKQANSMRSSLATVPQSEGDKANKQLLLNTTATLQLQASAVGGLSRSAARIGLLSGVSAASIDTLFETPLNFTEAFAANGDLTQDNKKPGNLVIKFGSLPASRYTIVHTVAGSSGYDVAVFYTCSTSGSAKLAATAGQAKVLVLARTPVLSASALDGVKTALKQKGIVLGGANPLVATVQDKAQCKGV
eukprot:TRINITY_DN2062_c0_g1_i1.p1 TRINITY_DN2062_c0_g1~~TRINITY_DN2062_c0_g1_i1.p1  ORF type:complete len:434 (-),score=34.34 TRINITY_DN2062_c0_g1_i1:161-1462(-)